MKIIHERVIVISEQEMKQPDIDLKVAEYHFVFCEYSNGYLQLIKARNLPS